MRALARATCVNYVPFVRGFLTDRFGRGPVALSRLSAGDVVRFVQRQAPQLHLKRAKLLTSALRSFLRYARYRGAVALDLAAAVPIVANWSMPSIPRAIGADQIRQLLTSFDRRTAIGCRDYAIVLLLARLGLRSGEVAGLELDDIDWDAGQVSVRGKRGHRTALPLPADVGAAIAAYLRHGRPRSPNRRVFLRSKAPIGGFRSQCGIGSIIRHALQRAGIQAPTTGAHQFRHALATEMLRHGASLAEIGEILRHRNPQTTTIYAKVDLTALRALALPWPGRCTMTTLRQAVREYLRMRRHLGFKLDDAGKGLLDFVTFMEQHRASSITPALALAWAQQPSNAQPAYWARRLSFVRGFAQYRSATDPHTQIPAEGLLPFQPQRARPYLYSDAEIRDLLRAALTMPCRYERGALRPWCGRR